MDYIIETNTSNPDIKHLAEEIACNGLPADANVFFAYRNTVAWLPTSHGRINVKSFRKPGVMNSLIYGTFRSSKAKRSFKFACRLKELGFKTPEPLAYVECKESGRLRNSYYISQHIDAEEVRYVRENKECDIILNALGKEIARLHKAGVWMHDFSPGNTMFVKNPDSIDGYDFYYVDLNRISFNTFSRKKLMKMFKTLIPGNEHLKIVTDSYAEAMGMNPDEVYDDAVKSVRDFEKFQKRKLFFKSLFGRVKK